MKLLPLLCGVTALSLTCVAQDPTLESIANEVTAKHPDLALLFMVIGFLRLVFKPMCMMAHSFIEAKASDEFHDKWDKLSESPAFKLLGLFLDVTGSIKITKQPPKKE
jgi:hypothetical protein